MHQNDHEKLKAAIKDIQIAMMTTLDVQGTMHTRPMVTMAFDENAEFEGTLWFFSRLDTMKVQDIEQDQEVNLSYADPRSQRYASVTGSASLVRDKSKMLELWKPSLRAWFPQGIDDPQLSLIKIEVSSAEIWDSPPSSVVKLVGLAKSIVTGKHYEDPKIEGHHLGRPH